MKKRIVFVVVITIFLVSCTGFFDTRELVEIVDMGERDANGNIISTTHVEFDNRGRIFPVDVFSSYTRDFKVNKDIIKAGELTDEIPWVPTKEGDSFFFYLTYYMPVEGFHIPFIPQAWGTTQISIPFNTTTTIPIHNLTNVITNLESPLTNDVYIIIDNNFTTAVRLEKGGSGSSIVIQPENIKTDTINPGSKGLYKITPASTTGGYNIRITTTLHNLPSEISSLNSGNLYIISFSAAGVPVLKEEIPLNMGHFKK